jgi:hypothetical protein
MASRSKKCTEKLKERKGAVDKENEMKYALIRDQANHKVSMVPFEEVVSTKARGKLAVGDIVTHGSRDKRIRAMIILIGKSLVSHCSLSSIRLSSGSADECRNSMKIIERTRKPTSEVTRTSRNMTVETFDEESPEIEERYDSGDEELPTIQETESRSSQEITDIERTNDEADRDPPRPLSTLSTNTPLITEYSELSMDCTEKIRR